MHTITRRGFLYGAVVAGACLLSLAELDAIDRVFAKPRRQDENELLSFDPEHHPHRGRGDRPGRTALFTISNEGVRTRLAIISDVHLCTYDDAAVNKLEKALETLGQVAPEIEHFYVLGDISLNGYGSELELFASFAAEKLSASFPSAPVMHLLMGNHDYWNGDEVQFERIFADHASSSLFAAKQNTVSLVDGATIIKLNGPGSYESDIMDYTVAYDFLAGALEEAAAERPDDAILVMAHEPPAHMRLPEPYESGHYGLYSDYDIVKLIARHPQARMFSGHIHNPLDIRETVNNDLGFTSVHTSTVGSCFFIRGELVDRNETGSQGLVLDIMEDGSLTLHRLDFYEQEYIGDPMRI